MEREQLSWQERGQLWLRLIIRLVLAAAAVVLVAHSRKSREGFTNDDVAGSGDIDQPGGHGSGLFPQPGKNRGQPGRMQQPFGGHQKPAVRAADQAGAAD